MTFIFAILAFLVRMFWYFLLLGFTLAVLAILFSLIAGVVLWRKRRSFKQWLENLFGRGRGVTEESETIIDVEAVAKVPERNHSPEKRKELAARAITLTLQNKTDIPAREALVKLSKITRKCEDKKVQPELVCVRRLALSLSEENYAFPYTANVLGQCVSGFNEIERDEESVTGFLYALESAEEYTKKLARLKRGVERADSGELSDETNIFVSKVEILSWLFLAYPDTEGAHGGVVREMFSQVADKLEVYLKAKSYGARVEGKALLDKTLTTMREINVALDTMLKSMLSRELLQADVELDALRQEMRLRGLY